MKIGLTELFLIVCIAAIAIGPNVAAFVRRGKRYAKKSWAKAERRREVAAIARRAEREVTLMRLRRFGYCIGAALLAVLVYGLFLRPLDAAPQAYTAPAVREAAAQKVESAGGFAPTGYTDVSCVRSRDGWLYFSAQTSGGDGVLARANADGGSVTEILTVEGEITAFDFDAQGSVWFTRVGKNGGALCRASYDGWGAAAEQIVTQINGAALNCPSAVAVGADGKVYFADAAALSSKHGAENLLRTELLAHTATGCVYVYDPSALSVQRVLEGVAGASGLALSPDGATLYAADLGGSCVWAVPADSRGVLAGSKECALFAANLPGYPGGLAAAEDGTLYVSYRWARSGWLENCAEGTFLRSVVLRLPRNMQAGLFGLSSDDPAAEAFSPDGTAQAALYVSDADAEKGALCGREPGIFWRYREK